MKAQIREVRRPEIGKGPYASYLVDTKAQSVQACCSESAVASLPTQCCVPYFLTPEIFQSKNRKVTQKQRKLSPQRQQGLVGGLFWSVGQGVTKVVSGRLELDQEYLGQSGMEVLRKEKQVTGPVHSGKVT
eukprot:333070-Pelagomonas_calceolata.AAC.3